MSLLCDGRGANAIGLFLGVVYLVTGIVVIVYGVGLQTNPGQQAEQLHHLSTQVTTIAGSFSPAISIFFIVLGVSALITSVYCLVAVTTQHKSLLVLCSFSFIILILANMALLILAGVYPTKNSMRENMNRTMITNFEKQDIQNNGSWVKDLPHDKYGSAWASVQIESKCCGVEGPKDYMKVSAVNRSEVIFSGEGPMVITVPLSCCHTTRGVLDRLMIDDINACISISQPSTIHQRGCLDTANAYHTFLALPVYRLCPILIVLQTLLLLVCVKLAFFSQYEQIK